jgi:serine/threonine protein kinase
VSPETRRQLSLGEVDTLFGLPRHPMVDLKEKVSIDDLEHSVRVIADALKALEENYEVAGAESDTLFERAVRVYSASTGHERAIVKSSSGLSGAIVGRVRLESASSPPAAAVIKLLPCLSAHEEYGRYNRFVANRLSPGYFAPALPPIHAGLGKKSALVSTLAGEGYLSLFELFLQNPERAAEAIAELKIATRPWLANGVADSVSLMAMRQSRISDFDLEDHLDLDELRQQEAIEVEVSPGISHGDLHGENILVDNAGRPLLIDFGDVAMAPTPMDPVTLELSLLYHTEGPARDNALSAGVNWGAWPILSECYGDGPLAAFAAECRTWAYEVADHRSVMAFGYSQSLRQLKYSDVSHDICRTIAQSCLAEL